MSRSTARLLLVAVALCAAFWLVTEPGDHPAPPTGQPDAARGAAVLYAAGCVSCRAEPGAEGEDKLILAGGSRFESPFGTFVAPNVSPHSEQGIGAWTEEEFLDAVLNGVSPGGAHYFPAFPYASYVRMTPRDVADLWAHMRELPVSDRANEPHELSFPFNIRRGLALWKRLYVDPDWVVAVDETDAALVRGRYLVEASGHCGECHTPRDALGGLDKARWLSGAPNPEGRGRIPALAGPEADVPNWSATDIAEYLRSGLTPEYDSAGGSMVDVIDNTSRLTDEDRAAIAAYLKAL